MLIPQSTYYIIIIFKAVSLNFRQTVYFCSLYSVLLQQSLLRMSFRPKSYIKNIFKVKFLWFIGIGLALLFPHPVKAQVDSLYIKDFEYKFTTSVYLLKDFITLTQRFDTGERVNLYPNNPVNLGIGFTIKNTVVNISYGYGLKFLRDIKYGKTSAFDLQLHNYGRKYVLDVFVQRYEGFYRKNTKERNEITLFPNVEINQYGLLGQYVFNHKRFSYKAAFVQDEIQLRSAGSFLLGGSVFKSKVISDGSFMYKGSQRFKNIQFGFNFGYAHSFVLSRFIFLSGSAAAGINFGSATIRTFGGETEIYPNVLFRLATGYNRAHWSFGVSYVGSLLYPSLSKNESIGLHSGGLQMTFIRRFKRNPFKVKRQRQISEYYM